MYILSCYFVENRLKYGGILYKKCSILLPSQINEMMTDYIKKDREY